MSTFFSIFPPPSPPSLRAYLPSRLPVLPARETFFHSHVREFFVSVGLCVCGALCVCEAILGSGETWGRKRVGDDGGEGFGGGLSKFIFKYLLIHFRLVYGITFLQPTLPPGGGSFWSP